LTSSNILVHRSLSSTYSLTIVSGLYLCAVNLFLGYSLCDIILIVDKFFSLNFSRINIVSSTLKASAIVFIDPNDNSLFLKSQQSSVSKTGVNSTPTLSAVNLVRNCINSFIKSPILIVLFPVNLPSVRVMIISFIHLLSSAGFTSSFFISLTIIGVTIDSKAQYASSSFPNTSSEELSVLVDIYLRSHTLLNGCL